MVLRNGKGTRVRNLNRYLHRNPPEADQVSAPEVLRTATGICSGTLRNLTRYLHWNPPDLYQVSQLTWVDSNAIMLDDTLLLTVYDLVFVIMTSCPHCLTIKYIQLIIQIQSYTYKHTGTTKQWCCTQVCDALPWKEVQTHNVQVFALHTFVFIIRSCCWQHCLWICGKQPTWAHTYAVIVDYTLLLTVYGLVIVMIISYAHCHTIIHIQSYRYNHTHIQPCNCAARWQLNHGPGKHYAHTMCECSRCLLRCWCVHSCR